MTKPQATLFDVDGTLVDVSSIRYLVDRTDPNFTGQRQFDRFHAESIDCPPHQKVLDAWKDVLESGRIPLVATGRTEKHREVTKWWLTNHHLFPLQQLHRKNGDFRPDVEVKAEMLDLLLEHYDIVEVWDDNPHVIELWKSRGLKVNVMPGWPVRDGVAVEATSEKEYASNGKRVG